LVGGGPTQMARSVCREAFAAPVGNVS
jgi:hypothetical protein